MSEGDGSMENAVMKECIPRVRRALGAEQNLDDERALRIIEDVVLSHKDAEALGVERTKQIIDRLFYKTRRILGILDPLINDDTITEIMVNGPQNIFYEKGGRVQRYGLCFTDTEELEEVMRSIVSEVNREINEMNPIVDARLSNGSRVNGVYKNVAVNGPALTIRKFLDQYVKMDDLVRNGTVCEKAAKFLEIMVRCGYNVFVSGGTSSGKTTLLNALAGFVPSQERVIVVEDSMELKMHDIDNIVHMECRNSNFSGRGRVTMTDLIKSSLRMRPNRIIVGEVRGGEVVDMLQAMNTGHSGSMSTGHGNSVEGMLRRLEAMFLMAVTLSVDAIRSQIAEGIDIMVHLEKLEDGSRRVVDITELCGYKDGRFEINPIMRLGENRCLELVGGGLKDRRKLRLKGEGYADILRQLGFVREGAD